MWTLNPDGLTKCNWLVLQNISGRTMAASILFSNNLRNDSSGCLRVLQALRVKCMFSVAGFICNSKWSSLSPSNPHKMCFKRDNLQLVPYGHLWYFSRQISRVGRSVLYWLVTLLCLYSVFCNSIFFLNTVDRAYVQCRYREITITPTSKTQDLWLHCGFIFPKCATIHDGLESGK